MYPQFNTIPTDDQLGPFENALVEVLLDPGTEKVFFAESAYTTSLIPILMYKQNPCDLYPGPIF